MSVPESTTTFDLQKGEPYHNLDLFVYRANHAFPATDLAIIEDEDDDVPALVPDLDEHPRAVRATPAVRAKL
ncbi:hypothetical protein C8R47DRAFT_1206513 [Mycena vitilis]|nr:hypothetical protein C8R47DRAFT_1217218 [Mycena vitilis]KAJ6515177.1 hypothetical protein C8R47DRAFT_1206513 [Mycena vitilis]